MFVFFSSRIIMVNYIFLITLLHHAPYISFTVTSADDAF